MREAAIQLTRENPLASILPKGGIPLRKLALIATVVSAVVGLVLLAIATSQEAFSATDLQIANWIQSLDVPGMSPLLDAVNFFTNAHPALVTWVALMAFFVLRGRPLEAIAVFLVAGVWVAGEGISRIVGPTFPSGHTTHAVTLFGLLALLALKDSQGRYLRIGLPLLAVTLIALTSMGRIYDEAHWPSEVFASYLVGFLGLVAILWVYTRIKEDNLRLPKLRKKQPAAAPEGVILAGSVASTVYLDPRAGTATKEYHPPKAVRALYWLAFQAPFPYEHRKDALEAAAAKRRIAGLLTKHRFGYNMVAEVYDLRPTDSSYQFVTEFITGTEPSCNEEVEDLLADLSGHFREVGLPGWQIAPGNPHAYSNFIRTPDGELKLIDMESAIISIPSLKDLRPLMRDGNLPVFDDVDFVKLHSYVTKNVESLVESLGMQGYEELDQAIEAAQESTRTWKSSERRIWGRLASWVYRHLDLSKVVNSLNDRRESAEATARAFAVKAVDRWEREGYLSREKAISLRETLATNESRDVMMHMGAHLCLSVAIAVPIPGVRSLARFAWTAGFRLRAIYRRVRGRISQEEYQVEKSIHSIPVMLLSLIPGLGAISYVAGGTMLRSGLARILVDQSLCKLPFGMYRRLNMALIMTPRPARSTTRGLLETVPQTVSIHRGHQRTQRS
jgi:membrane-associated phospholipid phosphatase